MLRSNSNSNRGGDASNLQPAPATQLEDVADSSDQKSLVIVPLSRVSEPDADSILTLHYLTSMTHWMRNELDPRIARYGDSILTADHTLQLQTFFAQLLVADLTRETIRQSRVHMAVMQVQGKATRWPHGLVDMADEIVRRWCSRLGLSHLATLRTPLYEPGGRLHGIYNPNDLHRSQIVQRWLDDPNSRVSQLNAWVHGHLGFTPGQWWIHPLCAFHAGIIDSPSPWGGITADEESAYAVVLTHYAEMETRLDETDPVQPRDTLVFRAKNNDPGRWRLMDAFLPPKPPIRILRSHTLHSERRPVVGLRYDGLYSLISYSLKLVDEETTIDFRFKRHGDQVNLSRVLQHPLADEIDDYHECRRIREAHRKEETASQHVSSRTAKMMHMNDSLDDWPFVEESAEAALEDQRLRPSDDKATADATHLHRWNALTDLTDSTRFAAPLLSEQLKLSRARPLPRSI